MEVRIDGVIYIPINEAYKYKPGEQCPRCGSTDTRVYDSREKMRRRECNECMERWKTKEYII